jgi:hypothetical protein
MSLNSYIIKRTVNYGAIGIVLFVLHKIINKKLTQHRINLLTKTYNNKDRQDTNKAIDNKNSTYQNIDNNNGDEQKINIELKLVIKRELLRYGANLCLGIIAGIIYNQVIVPEEFKSIDSTIHVIIKTIDYLLQTKDSKRDLFIKLVLDLILRCCLSSNTFAIIIHGIEINSLIYYALTH